jgi:amidohydrolase
MATLAESNLLDALLGEAAADAVRWRRHLHRHPELSFQEHETARFVRETLESFGALELERPTATSVVARLRGGRPGGTLALRADMDALPVAEENSFDFASATPGVMHACGHDGHTAMLLATARTLGQLRAELPGELRFLFQHAEEVVPGGAEELVAAGVLDGADAIVGCHLLSTLDLGKVAVPDGACMAATDFFSLTIGGRGGHAAFPHQTVDPVAVAAQAITNLQHIVSREASPLEHAVVSVTRIAGGSAHNVIPEAVALGGTVRTFSAEQRGRVRASLERIVSGVCSGHGATYELDYVVGTDPVVNDRGLADVVRRAVEPERLVDFEPIMGGDDFAAYLRVVPGCYFFVGAASEEAQSAFPHHHPRFTVDERALGVGIAALVRTALEYLRWEPGSQSARAPSAVAPGAVASDG